MDKNDIQISIRYTCVVGIICFFSGFFSSISLKREVKVYIKQKIYIDTCTYKPKIMEDTLSKETVYNEILNNDIQWPKIVLNQAIWETGHFKCEDCSLDYNNLFGMRTNSCITSSNPYGYIHYNTWQESVKAYAVWQKKWYKGGDYFEFLKEIGYAQDSLYIDKLKQMEV